MSHLNDLNENQLEGHKWSIENLLEQAKQEVARYEDELKAIAERFKELASSTAGVVADKAEEVVETVKEEVKKAAPKRTTKKAAAKTEEKVEESDKDSDK